MKHTNLIHLFKHALNAVDPKKTIENSLQLDGTRFSVASQNETVFDCNIKQIENLYVVGCGKAVCSMYNTVYPILGTYIRQALLVTKYGHTTKIDPDRTEIIQAGHPLPDINGVYGAEKIRKILMNAGENDLVIALLSGGGSALWSLPTVDLSIEDLICMNQILLECGASIHEINTIRKHVTQLFGGNAAQVAFPSRVITLIISDVIGDNLDTIASGPFSPDTTTYEDALLILDKYNLKPHIPSTILQHIVDGIDGKWNETPKKEGSCFEHVTSVLVCSNTSALRAIAERASEMGYESVVIEEPLSGEARETANHYFTMIEKIAKRKASKPLCIISGGETTVTLGSNYGKGGRNQEFALALALLIQNRKDITVLSCGTDGTDGPTDAAGAIVDGQFVSRCRRMGLNAREFLDKHDSYTLFSMTDDLVRTGPTLTNVMDIQITIID